MGQRKNQVLEKVFERLDIDINPDNIVPNDTSFIPAHEMTELIQERLSDEQK